MSCRPAAACGPPPAALGLVAPASARGPLHRRIGDYDGFARDLIARIEQTLVDGEPLGRDWDVEGDPLGASLVGLWAYVAEIVAAYAELTASEGYLTTASDWTDLRRLAGLVGHRARAPVAAQGWVRVVVDKTADPVVPAGTRVQAPGTPQRAAQTFEVAADTQLRADWNALTATWVPTPVPPTGRSLRFMGDPGLRAGDRVLLVEELPVLASCGNPPILGPSWDIKGWIDYLDWVVCFSGVRVRTTALAVAQVVERADELGTALVTFDRELAALLASPVAAYSAYRILETAGEARRLDRILHVTEADVTPADVSGEYAAGPAVDAAAGRIVLDAPLETLSREQTVALVDWAAGGECDVLPVQAHVPVTWEVTPGTPVRASRLEFDTAEGIPSLAAPAGPLTAYVVDRRIPARHHEFPVAPPGTTGAQLRLYPAPAAAPERIAVQTAVDGVPQWEVLACRDAAVQETLEGDLPAGRIVDLTDGPPQGALVQAPASANLVHVRHGGAKRAVLGSGDATRPVQELAIPDAPVAYDVDSTGNLEPTLALEVDGVRWTEVPSLYGAGPAEVFTVRLADDGGLTVVFGDGEHGARPPTGRANITAAYRVGGGTGGEVESGAIASLLGSVRGVKKLEGAGPTTGGADQDAESDLRVLAPARARAFGRAVSAGDLVDLARGYPGVTHAATWIGAGPPGCACAGTGLHLAFLRAGTAGPRAPETAEIVALAGFLDSRRDVTVPLCVCGAVTSSPPVRLELALAVDPRRDVPTVVADVTAALLDPAGPLAPDQRALGRPLDRSDVYAVVHRVAGVVGVTSLVLPGAGGIGRRTAERHELIVLDGDPLVGGAAA